MRAPPQNHWRLFQADRENSSISTAASNFADFAIASETANSQAASAGITLNARSSRRAGADFSSSAESVSTRAGLYVIDAGRRVN